MVLSPVKTSISEGEEKFIETKYSISYVRVSTKKQSEESKSGLKRQDEAYKHWLAANRNYKNLDGYVCRDAGVSGRGTNRKKGSLSVLLRDAKLGKFPPDTCVVVENMTRLCREGPREALTLILQMRNYGLGIAFAQLGGSIFWGEEHDPLWYQIMGAIMQASTDWKHKQGLTKGSIDKINKQLLAGDLSHFKPRKEGEKPTMYPFWLNKDEKINDFIVIKKWGELIQRIFDMGETMGAKKIAHIFLKEGITNPKGKPFSEKTIRQRILDNRQVLGEKVRNIDGVDKILYGIFPSLITPEQFDKVKAAKEERSTKPNKNAPNRKMVNLFQGVIFCSECGGNMQVAKKEGFVCKNRNEKNGEKIQINYHNIYCDTAVTKRTCNAPNSAPYRQLHRDIDNELVMLEKIANFRWESLFTDAQHEKELKVQIDMRTRFLNQSNKLKNQINNYLNAEKEYIETGRAMPEQLEELKNKATQEKKETDKKYGAAVNEIQNIKRRRTGLEQQEHIQKRVANFIKKDRKIDKKREEFNLWLKEIGIAFEVEIEQTGSNPRQRGNANYYFSTGLGMYDFISGKYIGLNQIEDDAVVLGMDLKQVREEIARRDTQYKEMSLDVGRDVRRPKEQKKKHKITPEEYEKIAHKHGGKTLKDLLKEQGDL